MKDVDIYKLQSKIKNVLEPKRYEHTLGVAYTAANLAFVFEVDEKKAFIAGLLHDCAKCLSHKKRVSVCKKNNLYYSKNKINYIFSILYTIHSIIYPLYNAKKPSEAI